MFTNKDSEKIMIALVVANNPDPLDYISLHTGIHDPLNTLRQMEERGLIRRTPASSWSCYVDPLFELMPATKKEVIDLQCEPLQ
jgi:hypothetical protein